MMFLSQGHENTGEVYLTVGMHASDAAQTGSYKTIKILPDHWTQHSGGVMVKMTGAGGHRHGCTALDKYGSEHIICESVQLRADLFVDDQGGMHAYTPSSMLKCGCEQRWACKGRKVPCSFSLQSRPWGLRMVATPCANSPTWMAAPLSCCQSLLMCEARLCLVWAWWQGLGFRV